MEGLLGVPERAELRVLEEIGFDSPPGTWGEVLAVHQQSAEARATLVAKDFALLSHDGGVQEAEDMELIGDDLSIRKEALHEALEAVRQVESHDAYVLPPWNVLQVVLEVLAANAIDDFHHALILDVGDHGDEAAVAVPAMSKEVLIDADDLRPRVEACAALAFELSVEVLVEKACGALEHSSNCAEVAEMFAGPEQVFAIPFGAAVTLADASDRLGKGLVAGLASEAALANEESAALGADGAVFDSCPTAVVGRP